MATCKGCGATIFWKLTKKGHSIPLDPPEKRMVVTEVKGGSGAEVVGVVDTYMPHHATCPEADRFRKGKDQSCS